MSELRVPVGGVHPLDDPVGTSLRGPHAHFAERRGRILRYPPEVTPWVALPDRPEAADWADAAALAGPGGIVIVTAFSEPPPDDWEVVFHAEGVQLVDAGVEAAPYPEAVRLGPADVPEMLDLVARTRPGPFEPRTVELGTYLGVRRDGLLVAMAGERMHPPGWSEISGVCTDESVRGQGLAGGLVRAVAHEIRERGETPFLHAAASNTNAVRLYESLGFALRRRTPFLGALAPENPPIRVPGTVRDLRETATR
ncbi:GNAT family N-acetyltransferase [Streptomyces sp. NPDC050529]|uniref:GNAT family N-acetyltransferase n=1 Tax=unclassified Streptomyces TaxID=2593676 RepID=UPI002DD902E9|nr:GNAT family N-acetyltransferase [Streptomyces sp. NBC_01022]MEE4495693.1 GNAT family N-acetyltransferase [Streptomyces sp. BE230]WRZ79820.1 GNAT family N-acetyltransferase [Streptomyces sp. NBC_01022]